MNEVEINRIIAILKPSGLLSINHTTKEVISHKLFEDSNDRKEILIWLTSQFSENYSADIQNSQNIEHELVRKLSVLGFVDHSTKWTFIKGEMAKEEQMKIYNKIFRTVELLKSNYETEYLEGEREKNSPLEEEIYKKDEAEELLMICMERCPRIEAEDQHTFVLNKGDYKKNKTVDFDLTKAKESIKKYDDILASVRKTLEYEEPRFNAEVVPSTTVYMDSLTNFVDFASSNLYEKQKSPSNQSPIKLDSVIVGELHSSLQLITKLKSQTSDSLIVRAVDSKKTLHGIEDIKKKSLIF